jgi:hypothetical protein
MSLSNFWKDGFDPDTRRLLVRTVALAPRQARLPLATYGPASGVDGTRI